MEKLNDLYAFTKEDERELRAWPTESLLNLLKSKEDMILLMDFSNNELIKAHGKALAATQKQILKRVDDFISTAKDELQKRGIK